MQAAERHQLCCTAVMSRITKQHCGRAGRWRGGPDEGDGHMMVHMQEGHLPHVALDDHDDLHGRDCACSAKLTRSVLSARRSCRGGKVHVQPRSAWILSTDAAHSTMRNKTHKRLTMPFVRQNAFWSCGGCLHAVLRARRTASKLARTYSVEELVSLGYVKYVHHACHA